MTSLKVPNKKEEGIRDHPECWEEDRGSSGSGVEGPRNSGAGVREGLERFWKVKWRHLTILDAIKPDPPERVVATPIPNNVRRLEVSWNSPSTWPDVDNFPLKYFLRYRPLIRNQWQHVELSDSTSHTITDAYAGKEYIIQVAAKDTEIGTWSDWSVAVHATPWIEEPTRITTTEADPVIETKPSPAPASVEPRLGEAPVGGAGRLLPFSSPLLLGALLLLFM
uniref:ciliary neurotrophic factor receptor subunit alpha n=1 Tax=Centroberyx gerrardi TaxID=166262 RepID=UPI003AAD20B8